MAAALLVALTTAALAQTEWNKLPTNPVLSPGPPGSWDETMAVANTVLRHEGIYKMWYEGDVSFGYATSDDGITWIKSPSNPVMEPGTPDSWDGGNLDNASVVIVGEMYHMFYSAVDATNDNRIGHATSPDGINWTKNPSNPVIDIGVLGSWDQFEAMHPFVLYNNGQFHMYYNGHDGLTQRIIYATSPGGTVWTRYTALPMLEKGAPGSWDDDELGPLSVIITGDMFHMWYTGWNTSDDIRIGYATSPDGLTWTKHGSNPVLAPGDPGAWDDMMIAVPFVTNVDSLVMYYGGYDGTSFQTGYAGSASSLVATLLQGYEAAWCGSHVEISWTLSEAGAGLRQKILRSSAEDEPYAELNATAIERDGLSFSFTDERTEPGSHYRYAVLVIDGDGTRTLFETDMISIPNLPLAIERVAPNPFNPSTLIEYTICEAGHVTLCVYDVSGRKVRTLLDSRQAPGRYVESWNGLDDEGVPATSGVYFIRLESNGRRSAKKAVLAR
jgi:predicted GH43/DUF377 family glycosyl hydrolase